MEDLGFLTGSWSWLAELERDWQRRAGAVDPSFETLFRRDGDVERALQPSEARDGDRVSGTPIHQQAYRLVTAYRVRGHLGADLDPLGHFQRAPHPELAPEAHGLGAADLLRPTEAGLLYGLGPSTVQEVYRRLRATYSGAIGVEMMHISRPERRAWIQQRIEPTLNMPALGDAERRFLLERLIAADVFERFVGAKYVGTKRFSLEGGEALIPLLELVLLRAAAQGVEEVVFGMAHRGRLNVLCNILGKGAEDIFAEFEDIDPESALGGGDVKYHLGYSADRTLPSGRTIHLSLTFNPSHLEAVDPVVMGRVRAKQRRRKDKERRKVLGLLIHGDAAFAGQGLVAETLNLSDLRGYRIGGAVHVVINNQIGFTTAPADSRSTPYPTDVAKMIEVPIFHVNGDDPEAVLQVVDVAMEYRQTFQTDVVIDLFCFRRHGHNEADDPSFTQPLLYGAIERHRPASDIYAERVVERGVIGAEEVARTAAARRSELEDALERAKKARARKPIESLGGYWRGYLGGTDHEVLEVDTGVPLARLSEIGERIASLPEGFRAHPKIAKLLSVRGRMARGEEPLDWAMAEALALGSLLWDGVLVRMSGQDCRRGTFSQRHATIVNVDTGAEHTPLAALHPGQASFPIYDSMLSEAGVLGFEFGYSLDFPDGLVIWEAQFGDFVNGAQVILDQFVSSSEDKWGRLSGLVLLLPHGYEGQGPEHSSARFERFLQLAAEDNLQVAYPSTPAQFFHLLRRQALRKFRKPLIVMTPKSLLRLRACRSTREDLASGSFQRILLDDGVEPEAVRRLIACTGKVYYELEAERRRRNADDLAIVRVEQLYPLSEGAIRTAVARYPRAEAITWVQEEPANMGARRFVLARLIPLFPTLRVRAVAREESASPATGSHRAHVAEQERLLDQAFASR